MEGSKTKRLTLLAAITAALVIIIDQAVKFYVKTHF